MGILNHPYVSVLSEQCLGSEKIENLFRVGILPGCAKNTINIIKKKIDRKT